MSSTRDQFIRRCAIIAAAVCIGLAARAADGVKKGDTAPALSGFALEGAVPDIAGKVAIIDFWASWCGPCAASMPELEKIHQKYKDRGLVVLGVNIDEDPAKMRAFLAKRQLTFPMVRDTARKLVATYNLGSMPSSAVIGRDGRVAAIHHGFKGKSTVEELEKELEALLGAAR